MAYIHRQILSEGLKRPTIHSVCKLDYSYADMV